MEKENKIYETTIIINATLEDTQIDAVIEKVKDLITKNGGEIRAVEKWGRRRLSYTIQKKNNGFYSHLEFKAPGDTVPKLERHYQLDEQIIRYLTVQLDKKALKARELSTPPAPAAEPSPVQQEPA